MSENTESPFDGIDHLGIAVADYDAAVATYRDVLGFPISDEEVMEDRGLKVCFVDTGNSKLELLGALRDDSEISKFLTKRGGGVHHLCVRVKDIEKSVAEMTERGARFIGEISDGAHGTRVAFIHPKSTHGVLLELVQSEEAKQ